MGQGNPLVERAIRVLVIDDDVAVLGAVRSMIEALRPHWRAEYVYDSQEAVRSLRAERYDAILSDIHMPGLDPASVLTQAKSTSPSTPVVLFSGYRDRYTKTARTLGAFAVLGKPIDIDSLITTLENAIFSRTISPMVGPTSCETRGAISPEISY